MTTPTQEQIDELVKRLRIVYPNDSERTEFGRKAADLIVALRREGVEAYRAGLEAAVKMIERKFPPSRDSDFVGDLIYHNVEYPSSQIITEIRKLPVPDEVK